MISEKNVLQNEKAMNAKKAVIPVGLKLTEVGAIPEEWNICHLEDLGTSSSPAIKAGPFGSSLTKSIYVKSGYKVYGQEQVIKGNHEYGDYFISDDKFRQLKSCEVIENDILLSLVGTAGKLLVIPKNSAKGIINPRLLRFRFDKEKIDSFFFKFLFEDRAIQELLAANAQGGTMAVLNASILKRLKIPLPSLKEQKAIASVLSDTDALITTLEQLISKKKSIKTASMQQLLTGRTRLTQFAQYPNGTIKNYKSSELGLIPEDWEVARLAQVAKVIDPHPSHRAPPAESYGVPFVGIGDLNESGELINSEVRRVNQSILQEHSERYTLHNQPIGLGRVASIGKVIRLRLGKEPYAISPTLGVIDGFACTNDFLFYYLKSESVTEQFSRVMSGSTRSSVGMNVLKEILVVKISNEEQTAIANILSDMDAELTVLEQKLSKIRDIKQGMMQQLLTGRIRLPLEQQP
ncbi:restriction endonuclease subunit S [Enterobacter hormaechei]|nr:restriction endonuclease subunit S [Enterobacter hormaechei]MCO7990694.1 restriction endonuclease subunit S [Enterobacter hormaechei]MCO8001097.1 restriction endonuclease subunit S [Enterobacter hormaechei]MCO8013550.1 restriction endonuclease subunit S [Enterobacter hormaechei]